MQLGSNSDTMHVILYDASMHWRVYLKTNNLRREKNNISSVEQVEVHK